MSEIETVMEEERLADHIAAAIEQAKAQDERVLVAKEKHDREAAEALMAAIPHWMGPYRGNVQVDRSSVLETKRWVIISLPNLPAIKAELGSLRWDSETLCHKATVLYQTWVSGDWRWGGSYQEAVARAVKEANQPAEKLPF